MCAVFKYRSAIVKPGSLCRCSTSKGPEAFVWAGFARSEILDWWKGEGAYEAEVSATSFAERSEKTGQLVWEDIPEGFVITALVDIRSQTPLLKILTRSSRSEEYSKFGHPRVPVLERARLQMFAPAQEPEFLFKDL